MRTTGQEPKVLGAIYPNESYVCSVNRTKGIDFVLWEYGSTYCTDSLTSLASSKAFIRGNIRGLVGLRIHSLDDKKTKPSKSSGSERADVRLRCL